MLHGELHKEQQYIFKIGESLGYESKLVYHTRPTITCAEKLDLLRESPEFNDWTLDRIVKALYFSKNGLPFVGVVTPEFERNVNPKDIFPKILGMSRSKSERYWINSALVPSGMIWGTCSPFPLISSMGVEIKDIIFLGHPPIRDKLVDVSVGGQSKEMFQTSMHIPYQAIYEILREQFGERIKFFEG